MFTLSGLRQDLLGVTMFPDVLNRRSDAALVAHTQRYFLANLAKIGNSQWHGVSTTITVHLQDLTLAYSGMSASLRLFFVQEIK